jgi:hypothetical protein
MSLFSFIKEIKEAWQEGLAEAREELAAEDAQARGAEEAKKALAKELAEKYSVLDPEEIFEISLGAPLRETFVTDLSDAREEERPAWYLACTDLPDAKKDALAKYVKRDFNVEDEYSFWFALRIMQISLRLSILDKSVSGAEQDRPEALLQDLVDDAHALSRGELKEKVREDARFLSKIPLTPSSCDFAARKDSIASSTARISYLCPMAAGLGYIPPEEARICIMPAAALIMPLFDSWSAFAASYLEGEKDDGVNTMLGRKFLQRTMRALLEDPASPWVTHPWPAAG